MKPTWPGYIGDTIPAAIDVISMDGYCPSAPNGCSAAALATGDVLQHTHTLTGFSMESSSEGVCQ